MENNAVKALMQLKGVGAVSARRLVEAGFDDFAKIAAAGADGLRTVPGLNPRILEGVVAEAAALAALPAPAPAEAAGAVAGEGKAARLARVRELVGQLQKEITALVATEWDEQADSLHRQAAKLGKLLEKLGADFPARLKRTGKALAKAERRLEEAAGRGSKKTASVLKKTRKSLKKALS